MENEFKSLVESALRTFMIIDSYDTRYQIFPEVRYYWNVTDAENKIIHLTDSFKIDFRNNHIDGYIKLVLNKFMEYEKFDDLYANMQKITEELTRDHIYDKDIIHDIGAKFIISFEVVLRERKTRKIVKL